MLTKTEILALDQPYYDFAADIESLKRHQPLLDSLADIQKIHVSTNILLNCPDDQLSLLKSNIQSINEDVQQKNKSFKQIILRALLIRTMILQITEENHPDPVAYWLDKNFDASIFDEFRMLTNTLVERKSEAILKVFTRFSDNGLLISRIMSTFKESAFNRDFSFSMIDCQDIEHRSDSPLLSKKIDEKPSKSPGFFTPLNNRKIAVVEVKPVVKKTLVTEKPNDDYSCIDGCFGFLGL